MHALARAPGGGLYVGTSPDGRIYKVDAAGKSAPFFDPDDKYIWALAVDAKGVVYAATGDKGLIYRITPDGKGEVFYRTKATHVRALLCGADGAAAGRHRIARPRVPHDGRRRGLPAARLRPAGNQRPAARPRRRRLRRGAHRPRRRAPELARSSRPSRRARCPCRRCRPRSRRCRWSSRPGRSAAGPAAPHASRAAPAAKAPSIASRPTAPGIRCGPRPKTRPTTSRSTTAARCWSRPAARARSTASPASPRRRRCWRARRRNRSPPSSPTATRGVLLATANPAKVFRLSARPAADRVVRVGRPRRRVAGDVGRDQLARHACRRAPACGCSRVRATRRLPTTPGARGRRRTAIRTASRSPARRRATCSGRSSWPAPEGRSPVVTSVTAAYLQRNLRPEIATITIHPPGVVFQKPFSTGEAEIAGFDAGAPDRRPGASAAQPGSGRRRLAGAGTRRACRRFSGRRRTPTTTTCRTTCSIGAKARRPGRRSSATSPIRCSCGTRRRCPTAPM